VKESPSGSVTVPSTEIGDPSVPETFGPALTFGGRFSETTMLSSFESAVRVVDLEATVELNPVPKVHWKLPPCCLRLIVALPGTRVPFVPHFGYVRT